MRFPQLLQAFGGELFAISQFFRGKGLDVWKPAVPWPISVFSHHDRSCWGHACAEGCCSE